MHHPLTNLPRPVILDANVLLDSTFVSDGLARRATTLLHRLGFSIIVDEMVMQESISVLDDLKGRLNLAFDPKPFLFERIKVLGGLYVPPATPNLGSGVNRSDRHVAAAAREYGAWILTGDAPLVVECEKVHIAARFPWDVIMEDATKTGTMESLGNIIRVSGVEQSQGLIFARVIPGAWRESPSAGMFTVCDIENVGRLYYDNGNKRWSFDLPIGVSVNAKCELNREGPWVVCATYRLPGGGRQGTVIIRAGSYPDAITHGSITTLKSINSTTSGRISFGSSKSGDDFWNGHLRSIVIGPQTLSSETWRAIVATEEGAPNPYDSDALSRVLMKLQATGTQPILERHLQ